MSEIQNPKTRKNLTTNPSSTPVHSLPVRSKRVVVKKNPKQKPKWRYTPVSSSIYYNEGINGKTDNMNPNWRYRNMRPNVVSPTNTPMNVWNRNETFRNWLKSKVGAHLISMHMLFIFICFVFFETLEYISEMKILIVIPCIAFILGLGAFSFLYAVMTVEPGALPILEPDLQAMEARYYDLAQSNAGPEESILKPVNYYGKCVTGDYCFQCKHFKDLQTIHCKYCGHCIARFDHHCRFFGCCIGIRNFHYFFYYQLCLTMYYILTFVFSTYKLVTHGIDNVSIIWILLFSIVVLISFGKWQVILCPFIYLYIISKGRTAYESFYHYNILKFKFEKKINDILHNELIETFHVKKKSRRENIISFICKKQPRSILYDVPIVFDYESGDTESRGSSKSQESSTTTSLQNEKTNTGDDSNGFIKCLRRIFCCCSRKAKNIQSISRVGTGTTEDPVNQFIFSEDSMTSLTVIPMPALVCTTPVVSTHTAV